jgi:hypothetical protein
MNLTKHVNAGFFIYSTHENNPFFDIVDIVKETRKALYIKIQSNSNSVWIPKKGLVYIEGSDGALTVAPWFRRALWNDPLKNAYTLRALNLRA